MVVKFVLPVDDIYLVKQVNLPFALPVGSIVNTTDCEEVDDNLEPVEIEFYAYRDKEIRIYLTELNEPRDTAESLLLVNGWRIETNED